MESVPKELRNLRACLVCSLVKVRNSDVIEYRRFYESLCKLLCELNLTHHASRASLSLKETEAASARRTLEQFEYDGCENCEKFLRLKNNKENILTCTSANFDGIISLMTPNDSWVARWQRIDTLARGCYAISVSGKLPGHVVRDLKARGVTYKSRDRTNQ